MLRRHLLSTALVFALGLSAAACNSPAPAPAPAETQPAATDAATNPSAAKDETAAPSLQDVLARNPDLSTFSGLLAKTDLPKMISDSGEVTVFAPTNAAFAALPPSERTALDNPQDMSALTSVLGMHILRNAMSAEKLKTGIDASTDATATMTTSNDYELTGKLDDTGELTLGDARGDIAHITQTDIMTASGPVHIIDKVLQPQA